MRDVNIASQHVAMAVWRAAHAIVHIDDGVSELGDSLAGTRHETDGVAFLVYVTDVWCALLSDAYGLARPIPA